MCCICWGGLSILLVWAGIMEAFFSQYHEPVLPYDLKIAVGVIELVGLFYFLLRAGATCARLSRMHCGSGRRRG